MLHDPAVVDGFVSGLLVVVHPNAHPSRKWANNNKIPYFCIISYVNKPQANSRHAKHTDTYNESPYRILGSDDGITAMSAMSGMTTTTRWIRYDEFPDPSF